MLAADGQDNPKPDDMAQFVELLTRHQVALFRFVFPLVGNFHDAEDVMQEISAALWEKAAEFQPGTNFFAWARRVAYLRVLKCRRGQLRRPIQLSDSVLESLALQAEQDADQTDLRLEALERCLARLSAADRQLVTFRYSPHMNIVQVSGRLGRPVNSVYKSLGRIRQTLLDCVERRLRKERSDA